MKIVVEFEFSPDHWSEYEDINPDLTMEDAILQLSEGVLYTVIRKIDTGELTFDSLEQSVCDFIGFDPEELQHKTRKREVVVGRQILHYIAKNKHLGTLSVIGFRFGRLDHATVLHSNRTITTLLQTDKAFKNQFQSFIESFFNAAKNKEATNL